MSLQLSFTEWIIDIIPYIFTCISAHKKSTQKETFKACQFLLFGSELNWFHVLSKSNLISKTTKVFYSSHDLIYEAYHNPLMHGDAVRPPLLCFFSLCSKYLKASKPYWTFVSFNTFLMRIPLWKKNIVLPLRVLLFWVGKIARELEI